MDTDIVNILIVYLGLNDITYKAAVIMYGIIMTMNQ